MIEILNLSIEYASLIYSLILIFLVFRIVISYEENNQNLKNVKIEIRWLKQILIIGLVLCILWFLSLNIIENYIKLEGYFQFYPLWIGISILIYWIGYTSIIQNIIYKQRTKIRNKNKLLVQTSNDTKGIDKNFQIIEKIIIEQKAYLNPKLSLEYISENSGLSVSYISRLINKNEQKSFKEYVNGLRLKEATRMLINKEYKQYTIVAIALESGFNSKSAFYQAFQKHYNTTPTKYRSL